MPTLNDVAREANVTVTTVSRMLNNHGNVSEKTRKKIYSAMKKLNYQPNEIARSLAKRRSSFIGLIVPSAAQFFFSELIQHVEATASQHGYKLLLCISNMDAVKEKEYYNMLISNKVLGVIICNWSENLDEIVNEDHPMVLIEQTSQKNVPCVLTDNCGGGKTAGEHLIARGCKKLLYFGGDADRNTTPDKRYEGMAAACEEAGLEAPILFSSRWEEFLKMDYTESVLRMFRECPHVDGVLASNDIIAAQIVRRCMETGIPVPERMKVVGYDDTIFASGHVIPLTTVHQPIQEISRCAVETIIRKANGEVVPSQMMFPVYLQQRKTT